MDVLELPEEILLQFFTYLDLRQLHTLCEVCWTFSRIARDSTLDWSSKFLDLAQTEMDKQAYGKAIFLLNRLLDHNPHCAVGYKQRGMCWDHEEEPERAMEDFAKAVEFASDEAQRHRFRSYLYLSLHDPAAAYKEVKLALQLGPQDPTNYHQHAYVLFKLSSSLGRSSQKQEMKDYTRVLEFGTYDRLAIIHNNIGYVHYERGRFREALQNFNKSLELCPHHVRAYYNRSTVWEEMREWDKAIADYNEILSINPEVYDAYYFRSKCHSKTSHRAEAIADCLFSLFNSRAHIPSLNHMYSLFLEDGNIEGLSRELNNFEVLCVKEYDLLVKLSQPREEVDLESLMSEFPQFKYTFSFGKTKLQKQKDRFTQMLHQLYTNRGLLRLVNSDLIGARADFESKKKFAGTQDMADCFLTQCMEEGGIDLANVQPHTLTTCQEMLRIGSTRRKLKNFIMSLDDNVNRTGYNILNGRDDKMYFLACYSFRRLRLYRSLNGEFVVSFWNILNKNDDNYFALKFACSDPLILTLLFEAFLVHPIINSSFLHSLQEALVRGVGALDTVKQVMNDSETLEDCKSKVNEKFFVECRQLVVSHTSALNRGNGD